MTDLADLQHDVVPAVDAARFLSRFDALSAIGATAAGGVDRQALSEPDVRTHALVQGWLTGDRYSVFADAVGNVAIRRAGARPDASAVAFGSHLDSQPRGGRFDGALGVLAGAEVMAALDDIDAVTDRPLLLVIWMNEEGCRFSPVTMGSSVACGRLALGDALASLDETGASFASVLQPFFEGIGLEPSAIPTFGDYLELHIEQGPVLESEGINIGVVDSVNGVFQADVTLLGESGHAGTTPQDSRADALSAARRVMSEVEEAITGQDPEARLTFGRIAVQPNVPNTIANRVTVSLDMRHPRLDRLERARDDLGAWAEHAATPCGAKVEARMFTPPVAFDDGVIAAVTDAANACRASHIRIASGATHDAAIVASAARAGMIFVPSIRGVSHREDEETSDQDILAGTRVLLDAVCRLAGRTAAAGEGQ